jgi:hypothetical protein
MKPLDELLKAEDVELWFTDELPATSAKSGFPRGWVGVADVACNLQRHAVAVPRRKRDGNHFAEVLHEVAHLLIWEETGRTPTKQKDLEVCRRALKLGREYRFSAYTLKRLEDDLEREEAPPPHPTTTSPLTTKM